MRVAWVLAAALLACGKPKPAEPPPPATVEAPPIPPAPAPPPAPVPTEEALPPYPGLPPDLVIAPPPAPAPEKPAPRGPMPVWGDPQENAECKKKGGTLRPVCLGGTLMCVVKFRDAGKKCSDKKDCAGQCLWVGEGHPPRDVPVTGKCQLDNDPCGCRAVILSGMGQAKICAD